MLTCNAPNVQDSLNCWLPPDSGLREKIEAISRRHPNGFGTSGEMIRETEGTELMDTLEHSLQRVRLASCDSLIQSNRYLSSFFSFNAAHENSEGVEKAETSSILVEVYQRKESSFFRTEGDGTGS